MNGKYWGEKKTPARKATQNSNTDKHISVQENKIYYYYYFLQKPLRKT